MSGDEYSSEFADGVWWLVDHDGNRVVHGVSIAEAWDQLDGSEVWPNDECTAESFNEAGGFWRSRQARRC